ncbi:hypothetical protein SS50377_27463 [Spironucleus salmonicida]|uniref:Uncharacterized protein n=1 Tax=Spironucleus salmonicida TaxID=348837 RepID=V6LFH7_9EUKA|nr:hypothetical protein SS50377_27463 [Spironucleus salmonicida]|eukprot:EST43247.1 Hypothetical protein SS50377_16912 [Spironucleus salmonicida]
MAEVHLTDLLAAYQAGTRTVKNLTSDVICTSAPRSTGNIFYGSWAQICQDFLENREIGTTPSQLFEHDLKIAETAQKIRNALNQKSVVCAIQIGKLSQELICELQKDQSYDPICQLDFDSYEEYQNADSTENFIVSHIRLTTQETDFSTLLEQIYYPNTPFEYRDVRSGLRKLHTQMDYQQNNVKQVRGVIFPRLRILYEFNESSFKQDLVQAVFAFAQIRKVELVLVFYSIDLFTKFVASFRAVVSISTLVLANLNACAPEFAGHFQQLNPTAPDTISVLSLFGAYLAHKPQNSPSFIIIKQFIQLLLSKMGANRNSLIVDRLASSKDAVFLKEIEAEIQHELKRQRKIFKISIQNIQDELIQLMKAETALCSKIGIQMVEMTLEGGFYIPGKYSEVMSIAEKINGA